MARVGSNLVRDGLVTLLQHEMAGPHCYAGYGAQQHYYG